MPPACASPHRGADISPADAWSRTQCRQLAPAREPRAAEDAECIIRVLKLPAVVLLAHQLARRVAGEDEHRIPLGLFQQRAAPLGAAGSTSSDEPHICAGLEIDS